MKVMGHSKKAGCSLLALNLRQKKMRFSKLEILTTWVIKWSRWLLEHPCKQTGYHTSTCQKITPQYKNLPSRHVVLACRWAHLRRYWHGDAHTYVGLACRRAHLLFYYLLFFLANLLFGIAGRRFSMSTGTLTSFWYVDWHTYYFTIYYFSFPTYFLASRGVVLACRRTLFWHVDGDNLVRHVDGNNLFGMLTRRILDDQGSLSVQVQQGSSKVQ